MTARPHTVYHAAAYKHVPVTEVSVVAAARTNVLGHRRDHPRGAERGRPPVARLVGQSRRSAKRDGTRPSGWRNWSLFISAAVSSDRSSCDSATSSAAAAASSRSWRTRFSAGRNVPVTDPAATRFFMTAEEAVSLIIKADLMGRGGDVFWLDMGQPLRIGDLAERIIDWATPEGRPRVGIDIIGLRPGEKLREELTTQELEMKATSHPRISYARQLDVSRTAIQQAVTRLRRACATGDAAMALETLIKAVPHYEASESAKKTARLASLRLNAPSTRQSSSFATLQSDVIGRSA